MAKKKNEATFLKELSSDILRLQRLFEKYKINNVGAFTRVKSSLDKNSLDYDSGILELLLSKDEIPRHLSHKNIKNLRILFSTKLEIDYKELTANNDPLKKLEFNIYAYANDLDNDREVVYSFHLDRHIFEDEDLIPDEVHPMYHFQFGGRKLKEKAVDYGQALFFDSPRISYHPMDFILGLDFLLSNFLPHIWKKLHMEGQYKNILKKYQEYFMKPYYLSIANSFDRSLTQNWNAQEIYPQLVKREN